MSNADEIKKILLDFIKENFLVGTDFDTIGEGDSFMEKEIIDSTGILELTSFVEEEFGFTIEDDEMIPDNLDSINQLTEFIISKKG